MFAHRPRLSEEPKDGLPANEGHDVWGPYVPPQEQGVHGTDVAADWDICSGDAICVNVCPANVFDIAPAPNHPVSDQKSDPVRQKDCIK